MKFIIKKIYILSLLLILFQPHTFARDSEVLHTGENISNYLSGLISLKNHDYNESYKYLKKIQLLKKHHSRYNIEYLSTLVVLEKFDKAFAFSESVSNEEKFFFEGDLLLGLNFFKNKDYKNAEKYFQKLNKIYRYNLFDDFIGNVLIAWNKALLGKKEQSFNILEKIPKPYRHLKKTQKGFLKCYFDMDDTEIFFKKIIENKDYNFSRYNFFLANYLVSQNKEKEALKIIKNAIKKNRSNLLIEETENFLKEGKGEKIKSFFNCKNPNDSLAEFFYVIANLYASEKDYRSSNFYLKISQFLNNKFLPNKALLAENYYYQGKYKLSKNIYEELKLIGPVYSWYSSKSISAILLDQKGKKYSKKRLEKDFKSISNPSFDHYYEMANFYKDNKYYKKSIIYYSLALEKINSKHFLVPKILDRRGTSHERLGDWENAEKDLLESLRIKPNDAHVMNYLAYSWIDKGINLDKGLEMLIKANSIRKDDGYIIDSLGWAYYAKKDYVKAEKYLQRAVELLPRDPIINDHYGDNLWMLNKTIQARYIWESVLKLDKIEQKLKDQVNKKLIFGITNKL
ncbi:tetratricopeptide repeat protein [Pelagibacteraceae bacterium]|nr:tetratricopeptide repeat protein [Pelagibacteraceae bacterium]